MIKFKVRTHDTILFINRVIIVNAKSKEELEVRVKAEFPNSRIIDIEEVELE